LAYQIAFDLVNNGTQQFLNNVIARLPDPTMIKESAKTEETAQVQIPSSCNANEYSYNNNRNLPNPKQWRLKHLKAKRCKE
jgi:hypothetical protein